MATLNNNEMNNVMNAIKVTPTTWAELRAIIEQELKRQGKDADLNFIDTSKITDMSYLFQDLEIRYIKIDKWDVSNVTNMAYMFDNAKSFDSDLPAWDMSNVKSKTYMLRGATSFKGRLSDWDAEKITKEVQMD